jgi:hypothetical protein
MKVITLLSILLCSFFNIFAQKESKPILKKEEKRVMMIRETEDGKDYTIKFENDEVTSIKLNGKELPKSEFSKHQAMIDKIKLNVPKDFTEALKGDISKENDDLSATIQHEQVIKIAKNQMGQTLITFKPGSGEKEFEFVITGAEDIKMNGEAVKEGEIRIKTVETKMENEMDVTKMKKEIKIKKD